MAAESCPLMPNSSGGTILAIGDRSIKKGRISCGYTPSRTTWGSVLDGGVVRGRRNPGHYKLASRLKQLRTELGYSRSSLSAAAGLTNRVVGYIEQQERIPRLSTVARLASVLGVAPGWLAFGQGEQTLVRSSEATEFAARLQAVRAMHALSRATLAAAAGVLEGSVQRIEEGRGEANVETVERLAIALGVSAAWLAFGEGSAPFSPARMEAVSATNRAD